jgi:hypothetical protein
MLATVLSSHAGDGVVKATLTAAQCRSQVMLATAQLSHAGDGIAKAT